MSQQQIHEVDNRLTTHEEVCALRYEAINARLKRLEQILPDDKTSDENDNIINYFVTKIKY